MRHLPTRLLMTASLLLPLCAAAGVYKWKDASGVTHYGDDTALGHAKGEPAALPTISSYAGAEVQEVSADLVRRLDAANASAGALPVRMYSTRWCGVCRQARSYFQQRHIAYEDFDVEQSDKGREDYRRLGGRGVPIVLVGKSRMNGFDANRFESMYRAAR